MSDFIGKIAEYKDNTPNNLDFFILALKGEGNL